MNTITKQAENWLKSRGHRLKYTWGGNKEAQEVLEFAKYLDRKQKREKSNSLDEAMQQITPKGKLQPSEPFEEML